MDLPTDYRLIDPIAGLAKIESFPNEKQAFFSYIFFVFHYRHYSFRSTQLFSFFPQTWAFFDQLLFFSSIKLTD